jgi:1-aminocyclopropane-1-carboxylate deaminase/D-cysteine desulfhydrase-like pyridoxal-dependent ACC family enzyme
MSDDENTPIEQYNVKGNIVYVKREDLYMISKQPAYPPLAKLRGARKLLAKLKEQGVKRVGVFDTRISKAGQGVACICNELGIECWTGFQNLKDKPIDQGHLIAQEQGAKLYILTAGRTAIAYYRFKKLVEKFDGVMLPLGLVCSETVESVVAISKAMGKQFNSIVLSTGTGTIATGVASGTEATVYGVSCGMSIDRQWKRIHNLVPDKLLSNLRLIPPQYAYYDELDIKQCPFPTNPWYDIKAWLWLCENIDSIEKPICFYNIGQ